MGWKPKHCCKSLERMKDKIRKITRRNRGRSLEQIISELTPVLRGWLQYFQYARCHKLLIHLDAWIRRKLRCYRIKQCKRTITLQRFLESLGVVKWQSWILALSGIGYWRKSNCPQSQQAMGNRWFDEQGLYNLTLNYVRLTNLKKPPCTKVCPVCERAGEQSPTYSIALRPDWLHHGKSNVKVKNQK